MALLDNMPPFGGSEVAIVGGGRATNVKESERKAEATEGGSWRDHKDALTELAHQLMTGDNFVKQTSIEDYNNLIANLPEDQREYAEGYYNDIVASGLKAADTNSGGKARQKAEYIKLAKAMTTTQLGLGLLKTGAGLAQVLDAVAKENDLVAPTLPPEYEKNQNLAREISKAIFRADQGDPKRRERFNAKLAQMEEIGEFRAKAGGQVGQFGANVQANRLRTNQAQIAFEELEGNQGRADRAELRQLIGQDVAEDQFIQRDNFRRFAAENQTYMANVNAIQAQKTSGFNNMFVGIDQTAGAIPYAITDANALWMGYDEGGLPQQEREAIAPVQETEPMSNAVPLLLGGERFRKSPEFAPIVDKWRRGNGLSPTGLPMDEEEMDLLNWQMQMTPDHLDFMK